VLALNVDEYPLILQKDVGTTRHTEDEILRMYATFRDLNARAHVSQTRYVVVSMSLRIPDARERQILADEANRLAATDGIYCEKAIAVVESALQRGLITALGWLMPRFGSLIEVAPTIERAVDLGAERLGAIGIKVNADQKQRALRWFATVETGTKTARLASGGDPGRRTAT